MCNWNLLRKILEASAKLFIKHNCFLTSLSQNWLSFEQIPHPIDIFPFSSKSHSYWICAISETSRRELGCGHYLKGGHHTPLSLFKGHWDLKTLVADLVKSQTTESVLILTHSSILNGRTSWKVKIQITLGPFHCPLGQETLATPSKFTYLNLHQALIFLSPKLNKKRLSWIEESIYQRES